MEPITRSGHTLSLFQKQKGRWVLARDANLLTTVKSEGSRRQAVKNGLDQPERKTGSAGNRDFAKSVSDIEETVPRGHRLVGTGQEVSEKRIGQTQPRNAESGLLRRRTRSLFLLPTLDIPFGEFVLTIQFFPDYRVYQLGFSLLLDLEFEFVVDSGDHLALG